MSKKSPIIYNALILTSVNLFLRFIATAFQVFLSGKIGAEGIGLLQLVFSVGGLALTTGLAGIRTATMYLTAEQLGIRKPNRITHTLSACLLYSFICSSTVAILLQILAPQIASGWIGNTDILRAIRLYAVFLPVSCLCGVMTGYFTASGKVNRLAVVEVSEQIIYIIITTSLLSVWAKNNTVYACEAVVIGSGIGSCITLSILVIMRMKEVTTEQPAFPIYRKLLTTALPLAVADDLKNGINTIENLMVPKRLVLYGAVTAPLAAYGTVCGMVFPILMFPAAIVFSLAELLIPEMARFNAAKHKKRIEYLSKQSLKTVFIYGCFCSGLLFINARFLCQILYKSSDAGNFLQLYSFLAPMLYCDSIIDAINKGLGKQHISVQFNLLTAILDVLFLYLLLPRYGMVGYFISFLVTHIINFILSIRLLKETTNIKINIKFSILTVFTTLFAVFLSSCLTNLFFKTAAYLLSYFSLLILLGLVAVKDKTWMKGLIK